MVIEVKIQKGAPSNDWPKIASRLVKDAAKKRGISFVDAEAFVHLPESGRAFIKSPGSTSFTSIG